MKLFVQISLSQVEMHCILLNHFQWIVRFNFKLDPKIVKLDKFFIHTIIYFWNIFLEVYILHILDKNSISYQSLNLGSKGPREEVNHCQRHNGPRNWVCDMSNLSSKFDHHLAPPDGATCHLQVEHFANAYANVNLSCVNLGLCKCGFCVNVGSVKLGLV